MHAENKTMMQKKKCFDHGQGGREFYDVGATTTFVNVY